jgi:hypothetical protein
MDTNTWIERLYDDESITDGLADLEAEQVLSWAENHLATCESEQDALHLLNDVRLLSRYVQEGGSFEHLFAALRASALQVPVTGEPAPGELDLGTESIYPPEL